MSSFIKELLKVPAKWWLYHQWKNQPFCLVSNDCFGGEVYRYARKPYNTPFIGLMIMAPCYLKLLTDLQGYLQTPLKFIMESQYPAMNGFRQKYNHYPLGLLKDIEIHFLHYPTEKVAIETWNRRCGRMEYSHLRIKFSLGKDYATGQDLAVINALPYEYKLCIGPEAQKGYDFYAQVKGLDANAALAFLQALPIIDLTQWLKGNKISTHKGFAKYWYQSISYLLSL